MNSPATAPSAHLLIVDDTPTNIDILLGLLEDDYDLSFATSGRQVLDLLGKGQRPDLILLDIMMPEMDGYEVCEALKADPATSDIPVIFVTAKTDTESETRALSVGGVDFIQKPVNPALVRVRIDLHLELERRARALKAANVELAQHRDHLDELVHARTLELAVARDAAEAANRAKSTFLANMGHELRTPLNQILLSLHLLANDSQDEGQKVRIAAIERTSRHLLGLINDLLSYSKSEADLIQIQTIDFDLNRLLGDVVNTIRREADDQGLELVCEVDSNLPPWLQGDPICLQQILGNLIDNAVKFSEQGIIRVRVRLSEAHNDSLTLRFEVEDQGIGIPSERQDGLFQLLHQGDDSLTRRSAGTGLGLALCKRLVALMAGTIGVVSTPGQGSTFWFSVRLRAGVGPTTGTRDPGPIDWTRVGTVIAVLGRLLADSDCAALTLWKDSRPLLVPVLRDRLEAFEVAITGFDLESAHRWLSEAVGATPELASNSQSHNIP